MYALPHLVVFLEQSKYVLLFAGSFLEGPAVMMGGGILWRLGEVDFLPMYGALVAGDFIADMMWYTVGYVAGRAVVQRWGHLINLTPEIFERIQKRFHYHQNSILIVSKLTSGFGFAIATLVTAGTMRVKLWRYAAIQFFGGLAWVGVIVMVGYYFGDVLSNIPKELQILLGIGVVLVFFFVLKYVSRTLAKSDW